MSHRKWWNPVWEFVVHVMVGSALFAVIFAPAIALDLGVHWIEERKDISAFLKSLLAATKYTIATIDAFVYVLFMLRMSWVFVRQLYLDTMPIIDHDQAADGVETNGA